MKSQWTREEKLGAARRLLESHAANDGWVVCLDLMRLDLLNYEGDWPSKLSHVNWCLGYSVRTVKVSGHQQGEYGHAKIDKAVLLKLIARRLRLSRTKLLDLLLSLEA